MSNAKELLAGKLTAVEGKDRTYLIKKDDYYDFMNSHGVAKEDLAKVQKARQELLTGIYELNAQHLQDDAKSYVDNGGDLRKMTATITVNTESGSIKQVVNAVKNYPNPSKEGESVTHCCVARTTFATQSFYDAEVLKSAEETFFNLIPNLK